MDKPFWKERLFEGRSIVMSQVSEESERRTPWGVRWVVYAKVEICSGLFAGEVYDRVPIFSPRLKAQLVEKGRLEGVLKRGAALEGAPVQWVVKETAAQG